MDDNSNESLSFDQVIDDFPKEINHNDIQDLENFPRDSFVDHTPNKYFNNSQKNPFQSQHFPTDDNNNDLSSSSNEYESGYSDNFRKTMPFSNQAPNYQNNNDNNNNNLSNSYNYNNKINNQNNTYTNYNNNDFHHQKYYNNHNNYNFNQIKNTPPQSQFPIPQDTELEEDNNNDIDNGQDLEQKYISDQNINNINDNIKNKSKEIETQKKVNIPSYDNKKLQKLLFLCKKNGAPPSDEDFSFDSWQVFYPKTEKFFLWEKGQVIPNQVIIKNENSPEDIEIYQGEINSQGEKHGKGRLTTPKYIRIGTWRDDEFTGWGRESRVNGDVFEGRFVDGAIYGKGINQNKKGNVYVGEFVDSKREGKGNLKTSKVQYEGEFKYDKFNGKGKLIFVKQGHEYEGEFKNNEINGIGVFKWKNGDIYEGEMTNGKMNGYGKYQYANGQIYEGMYVNGVKEGLGKLISPNNIYEGEFKNGQPNGEGTFIIKGKKINVFYKDGKFYKK